MSEKAEKLNKLAKDVLILSRNTLLVNLRFLDAALSQFEFFPIEESTLLTDGKHILYNPRHILENYKTAKEIPVRDYLHMVMHCVFKHMYNMLSGFSLAQITEFIKVATENNCTNVTALLLDYKNQNFADFDPMEEFSLEL